MKNNWLISNSAKMFCRDCGSVKKRRYCEVCHKETSTAWNAKFNDGTITTDNSRNLLKSKEKIGIKSKKEIEQYVGNKDPNVVSEIERIRNLNKPTKITHRLFRKFGKFFKNVHEDEK